MLYRYMLKLTMTSTSAGPLVDLMADLVNLGNHRKPWENHGKMVVKWDLMGFNGM